jgi:hypothetical protein
LICERESGENEGENGVALSSEKHYRLVPPEEVTDEDLALYRERNVNE